MAVYKPTDEIKIPQSKYDKLKEDYLKNPKTAYSLYAKFNKEYPMDKKVFIEIIDKIRIDEGATAFNPIKKQKEQIIHLAIMISILTAIFVWNIQNKTT